jgi:hypothetical protein
VPSSYRVGKKLKLQVIDNHILRFYYEPIGEREEDILVEPPNLETILANERNFADHFWNYFDGKITKEEFLKFDWYKN